MAPSSRREAADSSTSWVSVSFIGSSVRFATASRAVTTEAPQQGLQPAGQIPGARVRSTRPQQSRSVCSGNPVLCARKYGFVGCFRRCEQLLVATSSSLFQKAPFKMTSAGSNPPCPVRLCGGDRFAAPMNRGVDFAPAPPPRWTRRICIVGQGPCDLRFLAPFRRYRGGEAYFRSRRLSRHCAHIADLALLSTRSP
jgi:hypothetical protein